ncbi:MAG: transcriptional regulator GcvA [Pseudomonadota bacterium]
MSERLPPLTALRAFDAAARHMSFAKAAAELNVTPAALSFQIKSLEEQLGQPVFKRLNRAVELTEAGRALAPGAGEAFARLADAWRSARRAGDVQAITVTAGPALTAKWLAPRIFGFASAHPEIELRFSASLRIMDFDRDEIDVAIRFGLGDDAGLFSTPVIREWVTPMMAPELAARFPTPEALREATLLHQDDTHFLKPPITWAAWFRAAGLGAAPEAGPRFSQADHALDAAMAGAGVVMGRISLGAAALMAGQLVAPFALSLSTDAHYRFVCPQGAQTRPQIAAFLAWIREEAEGFGSLSEGRNFIAAADVPPG